MTTCPFFLQYIQDCIGDDLRPHLSLLQKSDVLVEERLGGPLVAVVPPIIPEKSKRGTICLWDIGAESMVKIKVVCATNVNAPGMQVLSCFVGIKYTVHVGDYNTKFQSV